ncbi:MAG: hypothetical protein IKO32_08205 [Lachnospiraceae bacterium]|nr:hypothetical protein [Lachnospiraceae bacterium]
MVEKKRIISLSFVLLCALLIAGCTGKSAGKYTYKLNNIQYWESLYVSQTTYFDDRVEIKLDGENSKSDFSFDSPDKKDAVTDRRNDTLVIYSDNPTDITSLSIHSSWYEAEFRYLNTDEYACIWRFWADDLGWVDYSGDTYKYYTEEEKKQQREREEQAKLMREKMEKESEELFSVFLGKWVSEDGDYFEIYDANPGRAVKYYRNDIQVTEEHSGFDFSKYTDTIYKMTYAESGWGLYLSYDIEYSGEDFFVYQEKTFIKFDEEAEKQKNRTREYFENLDKDSSLDKIVEDLGAYGIEGSGILYHVWKLDDGSEAKLVFDSKGKIARIYISGDEQSEVIYKREY